MSKPKTSSTKREVLKSNDKSTTEGFEKVTRKDVYRAIGAMTRNWQSADCDNDELLDAIRSLVKAKKTYFARTSDRLEKALKRARDLAEAQDLTDVLNAVTQAMFTLEKSKDETTMSRDDFEKLYYGLVGFWLQQGPLAS